MTDLYSRNTPERFWQIQTPVPSATWREALRRAAPILPAGAQVLEEGGWDKLAGHILGEAQFGATRYQLDRFRSFYYSFIRPILPLSFKPLLRKIWQSRTDSKRVFPLDWPQEERFAAFQFEILRQILAIANLSQTDFVGLWPHGKRFAFVLTHDVETQAGCDYVRALAEIEERYGFRSCFNFVAEDYRVDAGLRDELLARGFEVGLHGLKHDGRLFASEQAFDHAVERINRYLKEWNVIGFRSPLTHRNPVWMQKLQIEYDSSFFDTDPYEPMPGGTMSIWPFWIGHLIELPYTLMQDHTLLQVMRQKTPKLWLNKIEFLRRHCGMALANIHPDYIHGSNLAIYEEFLQAMRGWNDYWHALPRQVAAWWRARSLVETESLDRAQIAQRLTGATIWRFEQNAITVPDAAQ